MVQAATAATAEVAAVKARSSVTLVRALELEKKDRRCRIIMYILTRMWVESLLSRSNRRVGFPCYIKAFCTILAIATSSEMEHNEMNQVSSIRSRHICRFRQDNHSLPIACLLFQRVFRRHRGNSNLQRRLESLLFLFLLKDDGRSMVLSFDSFSCKDGIGVNVKQH